MAFLQKIPLAGLLYALQKLRFCDRLSGDKDHQGEFFYEKTASDTIQYQTVHAVPGL